MKNLGIYLVENPMRDAVVYCRFIKEEKGAGLERTLYLAKTKKVLTKLKEGKPFSNDLCKIDHNAYLDLYPEYEYIFGPFMDSSEDEFNLVYLLYTNRLNADNELKVVYAARVLIELKSSKQEVISADRLIPDEYDKMIKTLLPIKGKLSNNCYYKLHKFTTDEQEKILEMYDAKRVTSPRYNTLRENFIVSITTKDDKIIGVNPYRLLYEIHHAKRRLNDNELVSPLNGKKADLRIDNIVSFNKDEKYNNARSKAFLEFGLDVSVLERLYSKTGYGRFKGIYNYGEVLDEGNRNRNYVQMAKNAEDKTKGLYLSHALMTVKLGRLLRDSETVDHIDRDKTNDSIDNLRLIGRSLHISEDSIRVEVDPVHCAICSVEFSLNTKQYSYYSNDNYETAITCSDKCKQELRGLSLEKKKELSSNKVINYRYYVIDKTTSKPLYFSSKDYLECKRELARSGNPYSD